jgi:acyl-CoA hydrolase
MPALLQSTTRCTLVLAAASPPDKHGYFSLGTNAEYVAPLIGKVPFFLEVNEQMPRTFGLNQVHESQLAGWCQTDHALVEVPPVAPDERDEGDRRRRRRARARRRDDPGRIGGIPNALLASLRGHKDLGIHTELLSDGIVDLVDRGVVTGTRKSLRPNKVVATFAMGTTGMYEWMNDNGAVEMLPVDYVNDPRTVSRERNFVSVNATTEVDLLGSARRRPSRAATGPRAAGRPTSRAARCTPRAAGRSSSCTRPPAAAAAASASASPRGPW